MRNFKRFSNKREHYSDNTSKILPADNIKEGFLALLYRLPYFYLKGIIYLQVKCRHVRHAILNLIVLAI